jgi:hypothetical protein
MKKFRFTDEQIIGFVKLAYAGFIFKELTVQATFSAYHGRVALDRGQQKVR